MKHGLPFCFIFISKTPLICFVERRAPHLLAQRTIAYCRARLGVFAGNAKVVGVLARHLYRAHEENTSRENCAVDMYAND